MNHNMPKKHIKKRIYKNNSFKAVNSLNFLLNDILNQIKYIPQEEKEMSYSKLVDLYYKGLSLREKVVNSKDKAITDPEINIILGLDEDKI